MVIEVPSDRTSRGSWAVVAVLAAAATATLALWADHRESPASVADGSLPLPPPQLEAEAEPEQIALPGFTSAPTEPGAERPFHGYCPEEGPTPLRPSFADPVNLRLAELLDRARQAMSGRGTSPLLRQGLSRLYGEPPDGDGALEALRAAPDRSAGGFDMAAASALLLGVRALNSGDVDGARRWAATTSRLGPEEPAAAALEAIVSQRRHDEPATRAALRRAFELDRDEPGVALALGRLAAHTTDLELASRALDAYLEAAPEDAAMAGLRARLEIRSDLQAEFRRADQEGITLLWSPVVDDALAREALRLVDEALDDAAALLGTARRPELVVVVYGARADLQAATCVQSWARAAFDGTLHLDGDSLTRPEVMGRHVAHETLHAQLEAVAPGAPVWLHEGLAQRFAGQWSPSHAESYRFMIEREVWVPFASLEGSFQVIDDSDDARLAYHQSLAMVELVIRRGGERAIPQAVAFLRQGGAPDQLLDHLGGERPFTGQELLDHLRERVSAEE